MTQSEHHSDRNEIGRKTLLSMNIEPKLFSIPINGSIHRKLIKRRHQSRLTGAKTEPKSLGPKDRTIAAKTIKIKEKRG